MDNRDPRWYRNPMVWMVIFFPAVAVVAGLTTVYIAVVTSDGLVEDDYYKQGLQINRVIDRDRRATELGLRAAIRIDAGSGETSVRLSADRPLPESGELALRLVHRTIPGLDQQTTLVANREDPTRFAGYLRPPIGEGRWTLMLQAGDWRLKQSFMTGPAQSLIDIEMLPR
jgi:hypothetical protein